MTKLGPSQKAVYEWLKDNPHSTAQQVGDAIYEQTSSCSPSKGVYPTGSNWPVEKVRKMWAAKLLGILVKRGIVFRAGRNEYVVDVKSEEERK